MNATSDLHKASRFWPPAVTFIVSWGASFYSFSSLFIMFINKQDKLYMQSWEPLVGFSNPGLNPSFFFLTDKPKYCCFINHLICTFEILTVCISFSPHVTSLTRVCVCVSVCDWIFQPGV